jgi:hypothetical protein
MKTGQARNVFAHARPDPVLPRHKPGHAARERLLLLGIGIVGIVLAQDQDLGGVRFPLEHRD